MGGDIPGEAGAFRGPTLPMACPFPKWGWGRMSPGGRGPLTAGGSGGGVFRLCAFGGAYWPLAAAHSDPLWARTCFGCVNGAPG